MGGICGAGGWLAPEGEREGGGEERGDKEKGAEELRRFAPGDGDGKCAEEDESAQEQKREGDDPTQDAEVVGAAVGCRWAVRQRRWGATAGGDRRQDAARMGKGGWDATHQRERLAGGGKQDKAKWRKMRLSFAGRRVGA